jgi:hypothetical protein
MRGSVLVLITLSLASALVLAASAYASATFTGLVPSTVRATTVVAVTPSDGEDRRCVGCHHQLVRPHAPASAALRITSALVQYRVERAGR